MKYSSTGTKLLAFFGLRQRRSPRQIKSRKLFRVRLEHESACADRNQHSLSLLVFDIIGMKTADRTVRKFVQVVINRIRTTDVAGWLDETHLGILLLYTPENGARQLAEDIYQAIDFEMGRPQCQIYVYPFDWRNRSDNLGKFSREAIPKRAFSKTAQPFQKNVTASHHRHDKTADNYKPIHTKALSELLLDNRPGWKSAMDLVGAILGLIIFSPIMLGIAVAVKLTSSGPIFFKQPRVGLGGKVFLCYKFRSMEIDAEEKKQNLARYNEQTGPVFKLRTDPRVSPIGKVLRKWSLDELPQLWNVLKGEMSLVGPRPLPCDEANQYQGWHLQRFSVTPGLTCIWQVSGRSDIQFERRIRMDVHYAKARSFMLDMMILLRTFPAVLSKRGAY